MSSEEGVEQDYNSLHAQRETGEAFARSQAGEGCIWLKTAYDDGLSGGDADARLVKRLLNHIEKELRRRRCGGKGRSSDQIDG